MSGSDEEQQSVMVKFKDMKLPQINKLLRSLKADTSGIKAQKVARLQDCYGAEGIGADELQEAMDESSWFEEMKELKEMVGNLAKTVQQMITTTSVVTSLDNSTTVAAEQMVSAAVTRAEENPSSSRSAHNSPARSTSDASIRRGMTDVIGILPDFDPLKSYVSSHQFIGKVNELRGIYSWTEQETLFAVQHKLKGIAKEWMDAQPVFHTWEQFVEILLADFPSLVDVTELHREMGRRKRKSSESLKEFYYTMLNLGRKANMEERSIISYTVAGLNDAGLTKTLMAMNLKTCTELLSSLENLAPLQNPPRPISDAKAETQGNRSGERKTVRCFNCNEMGHIATKCPQPMRKPRCTRCNKVGHEVKDCRLGKVSVSKIGEDTVPKPPVMKDVRINDLQYSAFVDTGSDFSLIADAAVPINAQREPKIKRLQGFGGAIVVTQHVAKVEIEMDGCTIPAELVVVPDEHMSHELLIGRDILCRTDSQVVIESGVMRVTSSDSQYNISADLDDISAARVSQVLNHYSDCFSENLSGLGRCTTMEMNIKVTTDGPVCGKRYQVPFAQRPILSSIIDNLLKHGIISPSASPHAAPVVLVKKSNGEERMCVDYRALNAVTVKQQFPMPVVEEQLAKLAGNQFFSTLDLTSGYYQIPVEKQCRPLTAFLTPDGLFEHNVMPFGLVNAPMVFQQMIVQLIRGLHNRHKIISYVDEVIIASTTVEEGVEALEEFLLAVRQTGLTLRPSKCVFMATTVKFLGHVISPNGIRPGDEKVECVRNFPKPSTATEIRQFLGLTGFFRKFIDRYSDISRPLTKLLKKDTNFIWSQEQENAFNELKQALTAEPVLAMYDRNKEHEVHTDASSIGISGILMQKEKEGLRPVQYYSRQCSSAESNYASHELEVLAVVESLERFRIYLLGTRFMVVTDCNAIATTKATTPLQPRIARWWLRLQEFDFGCSHRMGSKMSHVDSMSRAPVCTPRCFPTIADTVLKVNEATEIDQDWIFAMQMQDVKLQRISKILKGEISTDNSELKQCKADYVIKNSRLFRKVRNNLSLVVPRSVRWRIVRACHDEVGHPAVDKTVDRVLKHFWFPRVRRYVKSYIASCEECCLNKIKGGKSESQLHVYEVVPLPFRSIFIDHLGPFPRSKAGNLYILVIVCGFSKYVLIRAMRNTKTGPVVKTMEDMMAIFGQPRRMTSDRGTAFTSTEFRKFIERHGIQHVKTAVRTPRGNGQAERVNRTVLNALKCSTVNMSDWDLKLPTIQWAINSQRNAVTKFTPNELVFHYNPRDVAQNRIIQALNDDKDIQNNDENIEVKWSAAAENIKRERQKWKLRYDQKHRSPRVYREGDLVVTTFVPGATGASHKLDPVYKGPYVVTKALDYDRYIVEDLPDTTVTQRRYTGVLSADHLKPWCSLCPELDEEVMESDGQDSSDEDEVSGGAELSSHCMPLVVE